jgi:hypothetical protein
MLVVGVYYYRPSTFDFAPHSTRPRRKGLESILVVGVYYYTHSIPDFVPHRPPAEAQRVGVHIGGWCVLL